MLRWGPLSRQLLIWTRLLFLDHVEGCQAANGTSGVWTCACKKVAGEVVLDVEVSKCSSVAGLRHDPSMGVSHDGYDIPS